VSRVAIVTGASRGIGRAIATRLARDFSTVALVARTAATLAETAEVVRKTGAEPLIFARDLREPEASGAVVRATLDRSGRIDALVNVAGAVPQKNLFVMTDEEWNDGLSLKFHGARRLTLQAWEALKASNGAVVLTSGASALAPKASLAAVGTINAAISALAKAFSERGIKDGVQVNSLLPGPVMTDRRRSICWSATARPMGCRWKSPVSASSRRPASAVMARPRKSPNWSPFWCRRRRAG